MRKNVAALPTLRKHHPCMQRKYLLDSISNIMINRIIIFYYYTPYATQATRQRFLEIKAHYGREYSFYLNVVCKYIDTHFCRYRQEKRDLFPACGFHQFIKETLAGIFEKFEGEFKVTRIAIIWVRNCLLTRMVAQKVAHADDFC